MWAQNWKEHKGLVASVNRIMKKLVIEGDKWQFWLFYFLLQISWNFACGLHLSWKTLPCNFFCWVFSLWHLFAECQTKETYCFTKQWKLLVVWADITIIILYSLKKAFFHSCCFISRSDQGAARTESMCCIFQRESRLTWCSPFFPLNFSSSFWN